MLSNLFRRNHEKTISDKLQQYQPHRAQKYVAATVLLLTWKETDLKLEDEWNSLEKMFQLTFNYKVQRFPIPSMRSQLQLGNAVNEFLIENGLSDHLIIVYYGGHGGPAKDGSTDCEWWATPEETSPSLNWATIQPQLDAAECDVLILLDCCFAGQAVRARNWHYVEILAATDKDQMTPIGKQKWPSFTKVLISKMIEIMSREQEINIRNLHYEMAKAGAGLRKQPFYASSTANSTGNVILKKISNKDNLGGSELTKPLDSINIETGAPIFLEVYTYRPLDSNVLTSIISWLTKDSPSSIMDVRLAKQMVTDASSLHSIGSHILEASGKGNKDRPLLRSRDRDELIERLLNLQKILYARSPQELTDTEAEQLVRMLSEKSQIIDAMIQDVLATLDKPRLLELRSHQEMTDNEQIRSRIQIRLAVITNEEIAKAQQPLPVDFFEPSRESQRFRLGIQKGRQVLVEYWYYDESRTEAFEKSSEQARRMSALLLEPKSDAFRTLHGIGFVHEQLHGPRFGFIYEMPDVQNADTRAAISDVIKQKGYVPLENRIRISRILCKAMLNLHSVGWYHKAIHSGNVLLFTTENLVKGKEDSDPTYDFEKPYLVGYDCSRPSEAETRKSADFTFKDNLYRHPERWGNPVSFQSYHDIYAFGILLLEIGCWRTLPQMDNRKKDFEYMKGPEELREYLLSKTNFVAHYMGSDFASAVRTCLEKRDWKSLDEFQTQQTVRDEILARLGKIS